MAQKDAATLREASPYNAAITREQFLFHEMRVTARLMTEGLPDEQIVSRIVSENLFQYPTEKSLHSMALACLRRLRVMNDDGLILAIATQPAAVSKQICLYAMMKQHRLVRDFMVNVIGKKFRSLDLSFGKSDVNAYFLRLQEQDDWVATWSDSTIAKLRQLLVKILVENEYLDNIKSESLKPVRLYPALEAAVRDKSILLAFGRCCDV